MGPKWGPKRGPKWGQKGVQKRGQKRRFLPFFEKRVFHPKVQAFLGEFGKFPRMSVLTKKNVIIDQFPFFRPPRLRCRMCFSRWENGLN